eukprot:CAMPEP_0206302544 /NCGR_PEP_ID=MMETSP0106_2-20121207/8777_1 /ASSEMBLY_ACC=CAM_ASM_000206 /TAXON_ID=81532 /ORGANISM="Acanthoeca-like sp., Strain 10tr" /LENGTH=184 /DNA_ID=CAMNT_0053733313 /DNA_START=1 /DNA_END=555 /DNA_ORIENTATION=-
MLSPEVVQKYKNNLKTRKSFRSKRRTKDHDLIRGDMLSPEVVQKYKNNLKTRKSFRSKRRTKDHDLIRGDMLSPEVVQKLADAMPDGDLPGAGQFYCVACDRHMVDKHAIAHHMRSKVHKRRIKELKDEPYSIAEAEQAAGMGHYVQRDAKVSKQVLETAARAACAELHDDSDSGAAVVAPDMI